MSNDFFVEMANAYREKVAKLKEVAPLYPEVMMIIEPMDTGDGKVTLSTMAIYEHEGKKYKRHHVQEGIITSPDELETIKQRLSFDVIQTIETSIPAIVDGKLLDDEATEEEWDKVDEEVKQGKKRIIEERKKMDKEEEEHKNWVLDALEDDEEIPEWEEESKEIKERKRIIAEKRENGEIEERAQEYRKRQEKRKEPWVWNTPDDSNFDSGPKFDTPQEDYRDTFKGYDGGSSGGGGASESYSRGDADYDNRDDSSSNDNDSSSNDD